MFQENLNALHRYMYYVKEYPHLFAFNDNLDIVLDLKFLEKYMRDTKQKLGIVLENRYVVIAVDLIRDKEKACYYTYTRILNTKEYAGVVVVPYYKGKIVFLEQFRHAIRRYEIELPRGFSEQSNSIEDNVFKEIEEELGSKPYAINYIGSILSDTSIIGGTVHVFTCKIDTIGKLSLSEGIRNTIVLGKEEIVDKIRLNEIRDCFTLSAIYKVLINE